MNPTMKCISHSGIAASSGSGSNDFSGVVARLDKIAQSIQALADKPPVEVRTPLPEFHNEINVPPAKVDIQLPAVENKVSVEPAQNVVNVDLDLSELDIPSIVKAIYILSGVIGASALGVIISLCWYKAA